MQKNCFSPKKSPVVEFAKLDENNKAQFLQFLIKNNITFDKASGKQNFTAQITLKTLKPAPKTPKALVANHQTKKPKKQIKSAKKVQLSNKENILLIDGCKVSQKTNKTPLKNVKNDVNSQNKGLGSIKNSNMATTSFSPFRNVKQNERNHSTSILKKQHKNVQQKIHQKYQERTPDRKSFTQCSPLKSIKKSNKRQISQNKRNLTPSKQSVKSNVKLNVKQDVKQSFDQPTSTRLSSFNKPANLKNIQSSAFIKQLKVAHALNAGKKEKSRQKIRDKSPKNQQIELKNKKLRQLKQKSEQHTASNEHISNTHKSQNFQSQERIQLVSKYEQFFNFASIQGKSQNVNSIRQRPICWPLSQIQKFLDEFYDDNFAKNTHQILNGSKKFNDNLCRQKQSKKSSHITESLDKFLNKKFNKVQKVIEYNLINLLYSVAFYVNQYADCQDSDQNLSIISLIMFQDFMTQKNKLQDYLFFLFARNILKQDFKKTFITTSAHCFLSKRQIDRFLKHVIGQNNQEILEEYHRMIFQQIKNYEIQINVFIKILVDDYQIKRLAAEESHRQKCKKQENDSANNFFNESRNQFIHEPSDINQEHQDSLLQNTFNKILNLGYKNHSKYNIFGDQVQLIDEESMEELTFGQETRQMMKQVEFQAKNQLLSENLAFWKSPYINEKNAQIIKETLTKDQFNEMIAEKLCQKTHQLVELLSNKGTQKIQGLKYVNNENKNGDLQAGENSEIDYQVQECAVIEEILFSKAIYLFCTVIEMNKVKWLKQLHISTPLQEDIETVEQIQLLFRKIKQCPTAKDIAEFCKLILTVDQITEQLSRFFV